MGDTYYNNVSLLLHCNGTNNSTTFTDNSPSPKTVSVSADAKISTTQSKFGGASGAFDGVQDYILADHADLAFGTGNFTIESWVYLTSNDTGGFGSLASAADSSGTKGVSFWVVGGSGAFRARLGRSSAGEFVDITGVGSLATDQWYHIAITRESTGTNGVKLWVDGTLNAQGTCDYDLNYTKFVAGRAYPNNSSDYLTGYLDDIRVTKGVARYTSNFTPPTEEFPNSSGIAIIGSSTITITPSATLFKGVPSHAIVGNATISVTPSATLYKFTAPTITGNTTISVTPSTTLYKFTTKSIDGSSTVSVTPAATLHKFTIKSIAGSSTISITPSATMNYNMEKIHGVMPAAVGSMVCTVEYHNISAVMPSPVGYMSGGDYITASCPMPIGAVTATNTVLADITAAMPYAVGSMTATSGCVADITATMPNAVGAMDSGAEITASCPMPVGAIGGVIGNVATITATMPMAVGAMAVTSSRSVAAITGVCPMPRSDYTDITATMPMPIGFMDATEAQNNLIAYAMNIKTAETTTYSNYAFQFIIRIGHEYYGVKSDGLYQLTGISDNGTAIDARFKTAETDMGVSNLKRVPYVYHDSENQIDITPIFDGVSVGTFRSDATAKRTKMARGPTGKHVQFEGKNVNGNELRVGSLEALAEVLSRKV